MDVWIPFLQSLIWPVILVAILIIANDKVIEFIDAVIIRVRRGDPFQVGPIRIGASVPQDAYSATDLSNGESEKLSWTADARFSSGAYPEMPDNVKKARVIRLTHKIGRWGTDRDGYIRRDVVVTLETIPDSLLDNIAKVTYYLPDTWPKELRIQVKVDRSSYFELKTRAYGEVTVGAVVYFNDETEPLILNRYCNFYDQ